MERNYTIEQNYRGNIYINLLSIKKIVSYSLNSIIDNFEVKRIKCSLNDNEELFIMVEGRKTGDLPLGQVNKELIKAISNELDYTLKMKPKNINIVYRK